MQASWDKLLQNVQYDHQKAGDIYERQRDKKNVHFECAPTNMQPAVIQNNKVRKRNPRVPKNSVQKKLKLKRFLVLSTLFSEQEDKIWLKWF